MVFDKATVGCALFTLGLLGTGPASAQPGQRGFQVGDLVINDRTSGGCPTVPALVAVNDAVTHNQPGVPVMEANHCLRIPAGTRARITGVMDGGILRVEPADFTGAPLFVDDFAFRKFVGGGSPTQ